MYTEYGPVVYRRALAILKNDDEARDTMQEVFIKVATKHDSYRGDAPMIRWIYRITTNHCLNRLRQMKAHPVVDDPEAVPELAERGGGSLDDRTSVLQILDQVDEETQRIVIYHFVDRMSLEEVAEMVGRSRRTVSKRIDGFRKKAKRMLEPKPARHEVRR